MATLHKYKIWCTTDSAWKYEWAESEPSDCPEHADANITASKTAIIQTSGDGHILAADGKEIFIPDIFPQGTYLQHAGFGDHRTNGRGEGTQIALQIEADAAYAGGTTYATDDTVIDGGIHYISLQDSNTGNTPASSAEHWAENDATTYVDFQFNDWVMLAGGAIYHRNADFRDWVKFQFMAPASSASSTPGAGNCARTDIGGGLYIYSPETNGDYTIDVTESDDAVPVSNMTSTGKWDWSKPDTGLGDFTDASSVGDYDMYSFPNTLNTFIQKRPLMDTDTAGSTSYESCTIPAIKPKILLPQWVCRVTICKHHESNNNPLQVAAYLTMSRKVTV